MPSKNKPLEVPFKQTGLKAAIKVLRDTSQPIAERLDALQAIQAASFGSLDFDSIRGEYTAALRQVAKEPDPELRQRALGVLAREHDPVAQKALLDGLKDKSKELVPPEKALQLLSYDTHSGAQPVAREILKNSDNQDARREAVRILASDPKSSPLLEKVLADKKEASELRRMTAAALHALNPEKLQSFAVKAVQDDGEQEEIVAACLTALSQFGKQDVLQANQALRKRIQKLAKEAKTGVKRLAKHCAEKYGL